MVVAWASLSRGALGALLNRGVVASRNPWKSPAKGSGCVREYRNTGKASAPGPRAASTTRVVDLRSDTVTKPTPAMRQAMAAAEVGDDVMQEDPTVNGESRDLTLQGPHSEAVRPLGLLTGTNVQGTYLPLT